MNRWSKELAKHRKMMRQKPAPRPFVAAKSLPKLDTSNKRGSATLALPSAPMTGSGVCARRSMTDPMVLRHETPEIREAIMAKASRLVPLYNKGPVQYVTPDQKPGRGKAT